MESEKFPYLDGLSRKRIHGPGRSHLELVQHHVSQPLVVDHTQVDVRSELLPCDARVHGLVPVVVVPRREQLFAKVIYRRVFFRESLHRKEELN